MGCGENAGELARSEGRQSKMWDTRASCIVQVTESASSTESIKNIYEREGKKTNI